MFECGGQSPTLTLSSEKGDCSTNSSSLVFGEPHNRSNFCLTGSLMLSSSGRAPQTFSLTSIILSNFTSYSRDIGCSLTRTWGLRRLVPYYTTAWTSSLQIGPEAVVKHKQVTGERSHHVSYCLPWSRSRRPAESSKVKKTDGVVARGGWSE